MSLSLCTRIIFNPMKNCLHISVFRVCVCVCVCLCVCLCVFCALFVFARVFFCVFARVFVCVVCVVFNVVACGCFWFCVRVFVFEI